MAVDITPNFLQAVKNIRSVTKAHTPQSEILRPVAKKSDFAKAAVDIVEKIRTMRNFLREHQREYMAAADLSCMGSQMSDAQRDAIDAESKSFLHVCGRSIDDMRQETEESQEKGSHQKQHQEGVIAHLELMLQSVTDICERFRMHRMQKAMSDRESGLKVVASKASEVVDRWETPEEEDLDLGLEESELQLLEEENQLLQNELNCMASQVKETESKVLEISNLSQMFSAKVSQQSTEIEQIQAAAVTSNEYVAQAKEQLEKTTQHSADFRIMTLLFLFLASFGLLFLDWYES